MTFLKRLFNHISPTTATSNVVLMIGCSLIFLIPALYRIYSNSYSMEEILIGTDDWNRYANYAIDIKNNGLLIESISGNYLIPAGFFYNYFIALCFSVFGEEPSGVYLIQSVLLGCTIGLTFLIFKDWLKPKTSWMLIILLIVFSFLDVYKYYTFRLLSENFALFSITLFFFYFKKSLETNSNWVNLTAGLLLGISVLTRPNILPFSLVVILVLFIAYIRNRGLRKRFWFVLASYVSIIALLPLRNFLVSGDISTMFMDDNFMDYFNSIDRFADTGEETSIDQPVNMLSHYFNKILFCFGYLSKVAVEYSVRPHWVIMWIGVLINVIFFIKSPKKIGWYKLSLIFYVFSFYLIIVAVAPIANYGFRFLVPVLLIMLGFSFMGYEKLYYNLRRSLN